MGVGGCLADVWHSVPEEIEGAAAVGRAVSISSHDRCDGIERNAQLLGHNLPVGSKGGPLAEVTLPCPNQYRVIGVDLDPGTSERRIQRILEGGGLGSIAPKQFWAGKAEPDNQDATGFDELAAR